jgi:hypothetical protein
VDPFGDPSLRVFEDVGNADVLSVFLDGTEGSINDSDSKVAVIGTQLAGFPVRQLSANISSSARNISLSGTFSSSRLA